MRLETDQIIIYPIATEMIVNYARVRSSSDSIFITRNEHPKTEHETITCMHISIISVFVDELGDSRKQKAGLGGGLGIHLDGKPIEVEAMGHSLAHHQLNLVVPLYHSLVVLHFRV